MATANTVSGILGGARQAEVTINGIGERAGNTSLEEVVMTFRSHRELGIDTNINATKITGISRLVSSLMNMPVQPNKAIVGRNAFAHSSGIHQDGVLKNRESYEIIDPKDVGIDSKTPSCSPHARVAPPLKHRLHVLGIDMEKEALDKAYQAFLRLADKKKEINDDDILMLAGEHRANHRIRLEFLQVTSGVGIHSVASIGLNIAGEHFEACASGNGPVDAAISAIKLIIRRTMLVKEFLIQAINKGSNDIGKVHMTVEHEGNQYYGFSANTDIIAASAEAFIDAINKFPTGNDGKDSFDKVWDAHVVSSIADGPQQLYIDRHYCHEVTTPQAFEGLRRRGLKVFRPDRTVCSPTTIYPPSIRISD